MKPHLRGTELKVGTTRRFTQPTPETETEAGLDKTRDEIEVPADAPSLTVPTTAEPKDI